MGVKINPVKISEAVSPRHHKDYMEINGEQLEWIDSMSRIRTLSSPNLFKAALEMQIRKYLDRRGLKDSEEQDLRKAKWYLDYLCAYVMNGNKPLKVSEVEAIIKKGV